MGGGAGWAGCAAPQKSASEPTAHVVENRPGGHRPNVFHYGVFSLRWHFGPPSSSNPRANGSQTRQTSLPGRHSHVDAAPLFIGHSISQYAIRARFLRWARQPSGFPGRIPAEFQSRWAHPHTVTVAKPAVGPRLCFAKAGQLRPRCRSPRHAVAHAARSRLLMAS